MESKTEKCGVQNSIWSVDSQKIIKTVATRCQILRLKCTKIQNSAGAMPQTGPDPAGELRALPRPIAGFKGPTSKGVEGTGLDMRGGECCEVQKNP